MGNPVDHLAAWTFEEKPILFRFGENSGESGKGCHGTSLKKMWRPSFNVCLAPFTHTGGFGMVVA